MNFIQGVPIFDTWTGILYNYATIDTNSLVWIYTKSFFEALIMGICVHTAIGTGNILQAKGLPILFTFVGIIAGSIIIKLLGVTQGFQIILYIAIMLIGILMMVKGVFTKLKIFNGKSFLMLLIESVLAVRKRTSCDNVRLCSCSDTVFRRRYWYCQISFCYVGKYHFFSYNIWCWQTC